MKTIKHSTILFLILFVVIQAAATARLVYANEEIISLDTRQGVKQEFLLIETENPLASVIVFAGGNGILEFISRNGKLDVKKGKNNFLVRSRGLFSQNGFTVAVINAPSDKEDGNGMLFGFRTSEEHTEDIDHVISFLKKRNDKPVWLIGTSRGTESAAYAAIHSKHSLNGLVLTSSMTENNDKGIPVRELSLEKITFPVLIVAHNNDDCWVTDPAGAVDIKEKLTNAKKLELKYFNGGISPKSAACGALSPHGFYGIEEEVVDFISSFIKNNTNKD